MFILQKVHNIWSKLTVTGVSAKQSVEIVHRVLGDCNRTASLPDLAHCALVLRALQNNFLLLLVNHHQHQSYLPHAAKLIS